MASYTDRKFEISVNQLHHSGWLKKQGGKIKSWKRRYFEFIDDTICYYKTAEKSKLCGQFMVLGNDVFTETADPSDSSDKERFLFSIKPGVDKMRINESHEYYLLCAASNEDRSIWVKKLKKVVYSEKGGAVFGFPLEDTMQWAAEQGYFVPRVVKDSADFLLQYGLDIQGIFRVPGQTSVVRQLAEAYDRGEQVTLKVGDHDIHTVASLLKLYFRELLEPIVPYAMYDKLKASGYCIEADANVDTVIVALDKLPPVNYNLLKFLCHFLHEVSENSAENLMTTKNLACVFANNILRCHDGDLDIDISANELIQITVGAMINNCERLFPEPYRSISVRTPIGEPSYSFLSDTTLSTPASDLLSMSSSTLSSSTNATPTMTKKNSSKPKTTTTASSGIPCVVEPDTTGSFSHSCTNLMNGGGSQLSLDHRGDGTLTMNEYRVGSSSFLAGSVKNNGGGFMKRFKSFNRPGKPVKKEKDKERSSSKETKESKKKKNKNTSERSDSLMSGESEGVPIGVSTCSLTSSGKASSDSDDTVSLRQRLSATESELRMTNENCDGLRSEVEATKSFYEALIREKDEEHDRIQEDLHNQIISLRESNEQQAQTIKSLENKLETSTTFHEKQRDHLNKVHETELEEQRDAVCRLQVELDQAVSQRNALDRLNIALEDKCRLEHRQISPSLPAHCLQPPTAPDSSSSLCSSNSTDHFQSADNSLSPDQLRLQSPSRRTPSSLSERASKSPLSSRLTTNQEADPDEDEEEDEGSAQDTFRDLYNEQMEAYRSLVEETRKQRSGLEGQLRGKDAEISGLKDKLESALRSLDKNSVPNVNDKTVDSPVALTTEDNLCEENDNVDDRPPSSLQLSLPLECAQENQFVNGCHQLESPLEIIESSQF